MAKPARTARPKKAAEAPETAPNGGMMTMDEARINAGLVVTLPLFALCLSDLNVRHTERDADIAALAEDIAARGLKQNLVVIPAHFSTAEEVENYGDRFEVVAGGRRYQAMKLLAEAGRLPHDHPVPVMVEARNDARETSLSENLHKVAMNPADEFDAFHQIAQQAEANHDPDPAAYVAKRFGVSRRHVEGRLRLASLHPDILDALRSGDLTVDSAKAYAGTTDHDLQLKVFKAQAKSSWNKHDPRTVRDALRGESLSLTDGRVIWIGIDAYRAAGGRTEAEMFMGTDGEERVTDIALLDRLCAEKAQPLLAAQAEADGYASALFAPGCGHVSKKPKPPEGFMQRGYEYSAPEPEVKRQRIAVYTVDRDGTGLYLAESYKPVEDQKPVAQSSYKPMTDEERAALIRANWIDVWAARIALGSFAGTPLEGRAFYPNRHWNSVQWEFADDAEAQAEEDEGAEPDPISALVDIRIRVTAEAMAAVREAAEAKADEHQREQEDRRLAAQLKREAEQAAREAEADDGDDDDSEFSPEDESCASDDADVEGEDA